MGLVDKALRATLFRGTKVDEACRYRLASPRMIKADAQNVYRGMPEDSGSGRLIEVQDVALVGERLMLLHHGVAHILRGRIKPADLEKWTWLSVGLERAYVHPNVLQ